MDWDLVVLRLHTDEGLHGEATAIGVRSSVITQQYLHELIAPVVLGRSVHDREAIYHELWNIDRHITLDPWPFDEQGRIHVPKGPGLGIELDWDAIENNCLEHRVSE